MTLKFQKITTPPSHITINDKDNAVIEALGRINRFAAAHLTFFPAGSIATTDFARSAAIAAELIPSNSKPGTPASPATGARNHLFDEVWEDLLAQWATASRIHRTGGSGSDETPSPTPPTT